MTASTKRTDPFFQAKPASDMARLDAHEIAPAEYDEAPDLADFDLDDGVLEVAGKPVRGRPALGEKAKRAITLRLDPDAIDAFKATGAGWQTRMNDVLVAAAKTLATKTLAIK